MGSVRWKELVNGKTPDGAYNLNGKKALACADGGDGKRGNDFRRLTAGRSTSALEFSPWKRFLMC
jgi:hypothetical protein